jgi:hypothetical protein
MCFKPIKPTVRQANSNDVLKIFNQLSLRAHNTTNNTSSTHKKNFVHNTTHSTSSTYKKTNTMLIPPQPSASSGFKIIGECDRPMLHGDAQSLQHGDAIF